MNKTAQPLTFRGIQALRGLAACLVVLFHCSQVGTIWTNGAAGVDIFFVISGFVMAVSTGGGRARKEHPARSFLARRIVRVAPLYWLITLLVLLKLHMVNLHPQLANVEAHISTPVAYIASSFLFIPYRNSLGLIQPPLVVGWTLSYEMFFYLLFTAALALRLRAVVFLTPIMLGLVMLGFFRGPGWPAVAVLSDPILLEFLAGVLLGTLALRGFALPLAVSGLTGACGLFALLALPAVAESPWRSLRWGLPATLIVLAVVTAEQRLGRLWPRWALLLGDASYSLYLVHLLLFSAAVKLLERLRWVGAVGTAQPAREVVLVSLLLAGCVGVSLLLYLWIEKPMNDGLRRLLLHEPKPRSEMV